MNRPLQKSLSLLQIILVPLAVLNLFSCNAKKDDATATTSEDTSITGAVAGTVGGAVAASDSSGKMAFQGKSPPAKIWSLLLKTSYAATTCPQLTTASGSGCTNASNAVDLTYASCSHGTSLATWTGTLEVSLSSGAAISCGTFPSPSGTDLQRQFVSSAGVPGTGSRTSSRGTVVTIDHQTANLGNFDNQTIAANIGTGYGTRVTFNGSGSRTGVSLKQRVFVSGGFDHSVVGSITLSESGTTRTASGTVTVYHNKAKVVGTSTFSSVVYNNTSCVPISGSITTAFAAGANVSPTAIGSAFVGKSESITFNSDGTGTFVDASGASSTVELTHCY